jgi:hypothetical protein
LRGKWTFYSAVWRFFLYGKKSWILKNTFFFKTLLKCLVILVFSTYDGHFEKIQALSDILGETLSKSDHIWPSNEFFITLRGTLKYYIFVVVVFSTGYYFSTKHQVFKNSWHGQISTDFDVVSLNILEILLISLVILWKWIIKALYYTKNPSVSGKTKFIKLIFLMKFVRSPPQELGEIKVVLDLCSRKVSLQKPISTAKNQPV